MSEINRSRAPRYSSRRPQQTALPAEITTPVQQAFSSEYQAAAEVNKQAEEQDLVKQQQQAEQERQQINRQSVATAKRVGQQTQMDPQTGAESVKKDTTGKPIWEAGFIGDPTPDNTGKPVVPFRDPTGRTAQVPLEAINRKTEPTGETFYEFDMTGEDGQAQRVRRPEDKSNPLFKIDEATGQRYRDVADASGSMVRQPLGIDPVASNQARINKRKEAYAKEKEALKFQEDTLQLEVQGEELNLKPLKEKLTEAEKLAKQYAPEAAKDKSRYEQRPDGLYRVDGAFGDLPAIPRKIETPDEIASANNWLKQKEQADKQLAGIKAEHDPIEQRVRDMEKRRNALAKQALAASKRAQTDMADMEIASKAGMDLSRPQWKQVLDVAKKDDRFQQIIAAGEAADQGSQLADAIAGAVARHNKDVQTSSVLEDASRVFDYLNAKAPKTMAEESAAAQVEAEQATKTSLVDMLASGVRGDKGTASVAPQRIFPTKHPKATDGRDSNVLLAGVNLGGKEFVIPTMIDGKEVSIEEAVAVARKNGLDNYPSFATEKEATTFARQNHGNIDENGFLRDPATTNRAREIATKSLGVQDPENWSLSPDNRGNYNLHHAGDEAPLGWLDTKNKRVMLFPSATVTDAGQQLLEKASADGFPVFHMGSEATGGGVPMTHQELRDYVAKGVEIARSAATPDEKEALLEKEGITPTDIREQVMSGRMSVQDGRWLNEKLFEQKELDNSPDGYAKGFAEYLAANPAQAKIVATGTREQKAAVANNYSDARAGQSAGNMFYQRDTLADRRVELAQKVAPTGRVEKLTTGAKQILAPMVGLLAQMPAWAFQEALKRAGSETEAGRLADEQFGDWQKRTSGFFHRINARDDVTESLTEFKQWANRARPGEQPPEELAAKVAKSVFDGYHQLTEESARDLNTSLDTFNVNKDPKLQALLQRYLTTSDPSAFEQMAGMMVMDGKDRKTQAEVMKYIERPRAATPELVADRAAELGLTIQPGAAPRLLEMATALGNSKDEKQSRSILTQASKMLGTSSDSDTLHALQTITTEATDDPDSWWGLTKGGFVAGRQEAVTELASTALESGLAMLTGGAATPEILAGKAARRTMLGAARAAIKRTATASLDALADESKLFATTRAGFNRGRAKLGSVIAKDAEAFAKEGITVPKFGVPLTAGQKLKNAAVTVGKTAAAAAPIEAGEEGFAAIGDVDPTIQGTIEQMGMGAIGAGLITPIFLGAATVRNAYQSRKAENMLGQAKAKWVEKFNERNAKTPGFKPITVADYDVWSGLQDNPAHKEATTEYQSALAEMLAAEQEAATTPVAGPATAAPPAPQTTPEATPNEASQKGQGQGQEVLTPAPEATPVAEAQPAPATTSPSGRVAILARGKQAFADQDELDSGRPMVAVYDETGKRTGVVNMADVTAPPTTPEAVPAEEEPVLPPDSEQNVAPEDMPFSAPARPQTPRQIAAQARLEVATQNLAGLSQISFSAADELRAIPEADRPLYTAVAKAKAGSTIYTADEAKALIKQNGANAVAFQKAEILPPDVQGPRNLKTLADLPKAIQVGPNLYRLPEGVQIAIPDALTASVVANAPSLGILLQTSAQAQAAAKPTVAPEYLKQWEQFGTVKSEGGAVAVTSDTRKAHEAAMFALKQAGIKPSKVVVGPKADGKTEYTILFDAPEAARAKTQAKPQPFTIAPAKDIIQQVAKANPKIVALLRPTPNANTTRDNGGMWIGKDENSIEIHFETLDAQLAALQAQGRIKSAEQAAEHVQAVLDEEIRHIANIEASRRLHKKIAPDEDYGAWRTAYYGKMWRDEFTADQRNAVMEAYGDTLKGASDYIKALEGLRMVSQVGSKWGKITEAVLFHLEQVLKVLRELVAKPSNAIQEEIENIKAVLAEYGYDTADAPKSSTQFTLDAADAKPVIDFAKSIPDAELSTEVPGAAADEAREDEPHITVLYGLTEHEAGPVQQAIADHGPVTVKLGKLSIFENDKYDVLKVEVTGDSLHKLNAKLSKLPNANTYPDYKPHMTIAYLKKGEGKKYVGDTRFAGKELTFDTMTFSPPKELRGELGKPELPLTSQEITIKVKKDGESEIRTLAFADPQDAAVFQMAEKIDSLNKEMKPEERKKQTAEIAAFADALAAKLTADGTPTTRQQVLGIAAKGKQTGPGLVRSYAARVRTQAIEGNIFEPFTPQTFDSYTKHGNVAKEAAEPRKQAVRGTRWTDNTRTNQRSDDGQRLISKIKRVSKGIGEPTTSAEWTWFRSLAQDAARMQQDTPRSVAEIRAMAEKNETEDPRAAVWWILDNLMQWPNGRPQNQFDAPADYTNAIAGDFVDAEDGAPSRLDELSSLLRDQEQTDIPAADLGAAILEDMSAANAPGQQNINDQAEAEGEEVAAAEDEAAAEEAAATGRSKADVMADPLIQPKIREKAAAKIKEAAVSRVKKSTGQSAADAAREASVTQAAQGTQQQKGTPEQRQDAIERTYGTLSENVQIINHSPEMPHIMRGRGLLVNINDQRYVAMPQVAFPSVVVDGMTPRGKRVFPLAGDKSNWVSFINARLNETIPDLDEKTDVYVEPYGGGLTYLQNLSVLKNTKKPIVIYVARYFEPKRFAIYKALKDRNEPIIDDIRQYLKKGKMYRPKTEEARWALKLLASHLADDPSNAGKTMKDMRQQAINNLDALIDLVSRPNVVLKPQNDDAAFAEIAELAKAGRKVTLFDDSNYADLPFERTADVYETKTPEQTMGLANLGPEEGEVPKEIRSKNAVDLAAQKKPAYDAVLGSDGTIIATNNMAPELLNPLLADYGQYGQWFGYNHSSQNIKDLEYQHPNGMAVSWQPDRPEYLAIIRTDIENDSTLYGHTTTTGPNAGTRDYGRDVPRGLDELNRETPSDPTRPDDQRTSTGAYESPDRPAVIDFGPGSTQPADEAGRQPVEEDIDEEPPLFSSPATLRAEILESQKGYISPKFKGTKAWLTPDGRWINVDQHYEVAPPDFWETNKGFDRDLTSETKAAGFARIVYDRNSGQLISEHDTLTPAQRSELKNTATELFAELVYDRGGLFSAPAQTQTPAFRKWFGDSKVTDEQGNPLRVYHGTEGNFDRFEPRENQFGETNWTWFFTDRPDVAATYALAGDPSNYEAGGFMEGEIQPGANTMPVYLSLQNPLRLDAKGEPWDAIPFRGSTIMTDDLAKLARTEGHDGLIIKNLQDSAGNTEGEMTTYVAFGPTQIKSATGNQGTFDKRKVSILASAPAIPLVEPGFYSQLQKVITEKMPNKADAKTIRGIITNPQTGIKADELKWTGVLNWLDEQTGTITKEQIGKYLADEGAVRFKEVRLGNPIRIEQGNVDEDFQSGEDEAKALGLEYRWGASWGKISNSIDAELALREENIPQGLHEVLRKYHPKFKQGVLAPSKYAQYQTPGGSNYREVVLTMPGGREQAEAKLSSLLDQFSDPANESWSKEQRDAATTEIRTLRNLLSTGGTFSMAKDYTSSHFSDVPNYVAHSRLNDRADADGKPGTFIEELQSDRHQQARKKGYKEDDGVAKAEAKLAEAKAQYDAAENAADEALVKRDKEARKAAIEKRNAANNAIVLAEQELYDAKVRSNQGIPDAPFRQSAQWGLHLFKRALRDAVAAGHKWIGWTKGIDQINRYSDALRQAVDRISWVESAPPSLSQGAAAELRNLQAQATRTPEQEEALQELLADQKELQGKRGLKMVRAEKDGRVTFSGNVEADTGKFLDGPAADKTIDEVLGKEVAAKIEVDVAGDLKGDNLTVGGEGMKGFYDSVMPKAVGKYVKQWGAKVGEGALTGDSNKAVMPEFREMTDSEWDGLNGAEAFKDGTRPWIANVRMTIDGEAQNLTAIVDANGIQIIDDEANSAWFIDGKDITKRWSKDGPSAKASALERWNPEWGGWGNDRIVNQIGGDDATVRPATETASTPIWRVDITPEMEKGVTEGQALFSAPARAYESMTFDPPFKTPFGDIVSYDWMSKPVGGMTSQQVSDWNQARTNPVTGRPIVHHFRVRGPDGMATVSLETALGRLSPPDRSKLSGMIRTEQRRRQEEAAGQMTLFSSAASVGATPEKKADAAAQWEKLGHQSPYFKDWTQGTRIIPLGSRHDYKTGEPVTIEAIHGTFEQFDDWDPSKFGITDAMDDDMLGRGVYSTQSKGQQYGNGTAARVFVRLKNPIVVTGPEELFEAMEAAPKLPKGEFYKGIAGVMQAIGYDGAIAKLGGEASEIVAFDPANAAIAEWGTFDGMIRNSMLKATKPKVAPTKVVPAIEQLTLFSSPAIRPNALDPNWLKAERSGFVTDGKKLYRIDWTVAPYFQAGYPPTMEHSGKEASLTIQTRESLPEGGQGRTKRFTIPKDTLHPVANADKWHEVSQARPPVITRESAAQTTLFSAAATRRADPNQLQFEFKESDMLFSSEQIENTPMPEQQRRKAFDSIRQLVTSNFDPASDRFGFYEGGAEGIGKYAGTNDEPAAALAAFLTQGFVAMNNSPFHPATKALKRALAAFPRRTPKRLLRKLGFPSQETALAYLKRFKPGTYVKQRNQFASWSEANDKWENNSLNDTPTMMADQFGKHQVELRLSPSVEAIDIDFDRMMGEESAGEELLTESGTVLKIKDMSREGDKWIVNLSAASNQPTSALFAAPAVRHKRSVAELERLALDQEGFKNWYSDFNTYLEDFMGENQEYKPLLGEFLSATSAASRVYHNTIFAVKAIKNFIETGIPNAAMPNHESNLLRAIKGEQLSGPKISQYSDAIFGVIDAIPVDRHITDLMFGTSKPTDRQIAAAKTRIRNIAGRLGWEPRQVMAALWAANQKRKGLPSESYETHLAKHREALHALFAADRAGEGRGLQSARLIAQRISERRRAADGDRGQDTGDSRLVASSPAARADAQTIVANLDKVQAVRPLNAQEAADYAKAKAVVDGSAPEEQTVWNTPQQAITSAATSINATQRPATFQRVQWKAGTRNADIGGGRFDNATEYLAEQGVENVIYDPYNRTAEHNQAAIAKIKDGQSDTATINNVLNVIAEKPARETVIKQAANALKPDGTAYFLIYEGDKTGDGKVTKAGWQRNLAAKSYEPEIAEHFASVNRSGNLISATRPRKDALMASPATDKQADMRQALDTMPPIWRDVLESSMNGQDADTIAARLNIPTEAVGNIQRVAEARLRILLDAAAGKLKPSVQPVQDNWYEPPTLKATAGRPDLALSGIPAVTAVDQRRVGPEEVTHAEMQTMANRMFTLDLPATERMLKAWMESGGMAIDTGAAPDGIKDIVKAANARQAGHMLMTAAAKLMVTRYALAGTNMLETANLIDLYRNTGTEQARALNMRRDPHQSPAERAAMFIQEALLTPPQAVQNEIAKNPGNKAAILSRWVERAQRIKRELVAEGYDIDATFQLFHVEQQLADAVVPESVQPTLEQADPATQRVVRSILEGDSWAEAARNAGTPIATAREAYNAFRNGVRDAYQAFKKEFLGASPADQVSLLGLPEWTVDANPDAVPVQTAATKALKQHRARRKTGGEFDLHNPLAVNRVERAVEMRKATGFDKLSEFWRASILTGPQTHVVNVVSGMTYGAYEATVKKVGAGALADMARMFGMKPDAASLSDLPAMLSATLPAVRQAFVDAMRSFQFESRMFDSYAEGQSPTAKNSNLFKEQYQPALKGTIGTLMRGASFRLMGAADEFVKSFFTRIEVAAQARQIARAQGHKGLALANAISEQMQPGSLAWLRALEHAKKITFQQKLGSTEDTISKLDGLAKIINNTKQGQYGGLPKGISHFIFPFVDTPANIFKQAVTISPLGGLLAIVDATQALRRLKQGNKEQAAKLYNAARALSDLTNQIVAWGAVLAIAEMVKPGDDDDKLPFITGTIPWRAVSKGEREIAYRTAPPQSIRIGDKWYSYRRLDPFATALAFVVDSIRDLQSGKPADEILPKIGVNMLHNLQDKTFLQGISDFMNAVQDPNRFGTKWATNIAVGFMPNLVRQSIRSGDDVFRENDLPNDMPFWDVLGRRIGFGMYPVGSDDSMLPRNPLAPLPATDVWGRPASKNTGTGGPNTDALLRLFSPVDTRDTANVDPLDVRLLRWNLANPDDAFAMTAPTREIKRTINGKPVSVSLSDAEHADLTTRSGQAARQAIGNRFNDRDLTKEDVKQIRQLTDKAHDMFRELAFRRNYKPAP